MMLACNLINSSFFRIYTFSNEMTDFELSFTSRLHDSKHGFAVHIHQRKIDLVGCG